mmetsp:Transcript_126080/g.235714  ORF Transcript_126080/g.235714 Transcript_126080/m.235714 type:complete len:222 (-) Transcript_126080:90-755(-)
MHQELASAAVTLERGPDSASPACAITQNLLCPASINYDEISGLRGIQQCGSMHALASAMFPAKSAPTAIAWAFRPALLGSNLPLVTQTIAALSKQLISAIMPHPRSVNSQPLSHFLHRIGQNRPCSPLEAKVTGPFFAEVVWRWQRTKPVDCTTSPKSSTSKNIHRVIFRCKDPALLVKLPQCIQLQAGHVFALLKHFRLDHHNAQASLCKFSSYNGTAHA